MCKIMDDLIKKENEKVLANRNKEIATKLIKSSQMSKLEISLMTDLTLTEVEEIAKELQKKM